VSGRWLTGGGAIAALAVGTATAWGLGWRGCAVLFAFFITSSALTQHPHAGRSAGQVVANGGVAAIAALAGSWPAFAGSLAAAASDTWATEIGGLSRTPPRRITTGKPVPAGTSGGITALGTGAGVLGAAFMAGVAILVASGGPRLALAVAAAGIGGMLIDSFIGATLQGAEHGVRLERGFAWLDNDAVNLTATCAGAAIAWSLAR
jgi:uncharacterized protein (TIGR00297 family)